MTDQPVEPAAAPADRAARRWRLGGLLVATLLVAWLARDVIGPFVIAGVLAYAFWPVVSAAEERTGLPRVAIVALGYVVVLGALAVVAVLAAERAGAELAELSSGGNDPIVTALHRLFGDTIVVAGQTLSTRDVAIQVRDALLGLVKSPTGAYQMATRAVDIGLQVILTLIVTFYFLLDGDRFGRFALRFLGRSQRSEALRIAHRIHVVLGRWLRGQLFLIGLVALVIYLILGPVLHVPYALALGLFSGVLEIIPLVGPMIAAALACTVAFSAHGTDTALIVLAVYVVVRQVEDQVVMPLVIGRVVHLHPVITIFAVLVGLSAWGILGGLMGVPVAAALNVTLHELFPDEIGTMRDRGADGGRLRLPWRHGTPVWAPEVPAAETGRAPGAEGGAGSGGSHADAAAGRDGDDTGTGQGRPEPG